MKYRKHHSPFAFLTLIASAACMNATQAQHLIEVSGTVVEDTCDVSVNGSGNEDGIITLETVLANEELQQNNHVAKETEFTIELSNCGITSGKMRAHFYNSDAGAVIAGQLNKTDPSGTGENWRIQLLSSSNYALAFRTSAVVIPNLALDPGGEFDPATGEATLTYKVQYIRTSAAPLVAGTLSGSATYVLYYN